jgi:long-chain fatty acid transport protein
VSAVLSLLIPPAAQAGSGIQIRTQSAATLGSAQAGMTAGADDVSEMIFNPAGLALGSGTELAVGATAVGTTVTAGAPQANTVLGTPIAGNNGGNAGVLGILPNLYGATPINENIRLGLGVTSYYGLGSTWDANWVGRYQERSATLIAVDVVPAVAFKPVPSLAVGIGPVFQYVQVKTTSALDFGTTDQLLFGGAFGGVPGGSDGALRTMSSSWAVGFLAGATYEPIEGTRVGVSYRSQLRHSLRGDGTFDPGGSVGQGIVAATGAFVDSKFTAGLNLPAMATIGIAQVVNSRLTLLADAQWEGWSSVSSLQLNFDNPRQPPLLAVLELKDTWFFTVGAKYQLSEQVRLRAGVAYDQSSVRGSARGPIIPDTDSYWVALGGEYAPTPNLRLNFAYGHLFFNRGQIQVPISQPGAALRGSLSGTIATGGDYVALQSTYRF